MTNSIENSDQQRVSLNNFLPAFILTIITLISVTGCSNYNNKPGELPKSTDSLTVLLTDNQANHKIDVLGYANKEGKHDLFVVSDSKKEFLQYAYLDNIKVNEDQLAQIKELLDYKRHNFIIKPSDKNTDSSPAALRNNRIWELSNEIDSLNILFNKTKMQFSNTHSSLDSGEMKSLSEQLLTKNEEQKKVSMEQYRTEINSVSAEVELHKLLTNIVLTNKYTPEQRNKLNQLILARHATK